VVLCCAWGKHILTPMLRRRGHAHPRLHTAVETDRIPGLFPEHCSVVTVHVLLRDTGPITQGTQGTRACSRCELKDSVNRLFVSSVTGSQYVMVYLNTVHKPRA